VSPCASFTSCITIVVVEVLLGFVVDLLRGTCSTAYNWCSMTNTLCKKLEVLSNLSFVA
jgi:hypothetical protein